MILVKLTAFIRRFCIVFAAVSTVACISFGGERITVKAVLLDKLNPQYNFAISPIRAQGASFGPPFGEQAATQVRSALQAMSLNTIEFQQGSLGDFSYEVRVSLYEYDYIRKLETWYSVQLCFDIYDSRGLLAASILCLADSSVSAANALCLERLIRECARELASAMLKRE